VYWINFASLVDQKGGESAQKPQLLRSDPVFLLPLSGIRLPLAPTKKPDILMSGFWAVGSTGLTSLRSLIKRGESQPKNRNCCAVTRFFCCRFPESGFL
jgi:hypothetical protein